MLLHYNVWYEKTTCMSFHICMYAISYENYQLYGCPITFPLCMCAQRFTKSPVEVRHPWVGPKVLRPASPERTSRPIHFKMHLYQYMYCISPIYVYRYRYIFYVHKYIYIYPYIYMCVWCPSMCVYLKGYIKMYISGLWWASWKMLPIAVPCATRGLLCSDLVQKAWPAKCKAAATLVPDDAFLKRRTP